MYQNTSKTRATLKTGLNQSEGNKVINALLSVQTKLAKLEKQLASNDSSRGPGPGGDQQKEEDSADHELVQPLDNEASRGPETSSKLDVIDTRLQLIEKQLDLMTDFLRRLNDGHNQRTPTPRKGPKSDFKCVIYDKQLEQSLMRMEAKDILYDLQEEYDYLTEESNVMKERLKRISLDDEDHKQLEFMDKRLEAKERQVIQLKALCHSMEREAEKRKKKADVEEMRALKPWDEAKERAKKRTSSHEKGSFPKWI